MAQLPIDLDFPLEGDWYASAEALMDEHHIVAVSEDEGARINFGTHIVMQMQQMGQTEVCPIYGRRIRSWEHLAYQISRALPGDTPIEPTSDGIVRALHDKHTGSMRRYIVWHDAHEMMQHEPEAFDETLDVLMGVAAEQEYASEDSLLLTRCLFIGSPDLLAAPGFTGWLPEGDSPPLWEVVSGLPKPPVKAVRVTA